jgi:hypothetical protein
MRRRVIIPVVAGVILVGGGIGAGVALSGGGDDEGSSVTGPGADRARAAALAAVPGGTATAVERDEEDGATWEVEVRRPDGISIDVRLDEQFQVVVSEADIEAPDTPPGR